MKTFDSKAFNPQAFKYLVGRVPNLKMNALKTSSAVTGSAELRRLFADQNGSGYARTAVKGLLTGEPVNYDGKTDIETTGTKTYSQGHVVVGRAQSWTENDFSEDITSGEDFIGNVAGQVAGYKDELDQDILLSVLKGAFSMDVSAAPCRDFVEKHTTTVPGLLSGVTLNKAITRACGDNKGKFSLVITHSHVASDLENLNLLSFLKYTDANGIERDLALATWGGRTVLIDDEMPFDEATGQYTTYILGDGAIKLQDVGVKVPYEMDRDPKVNGGQDTLYMRQRKTYSPNGISYEQVVQETLSPTNAELENGRNWTLAYSGQPSDAAETRTFINHRAIHIARIISKSGFTLEEPTPQVQSASIDVAGLVQGLTDGLAQGIEAAIEKVGVTTPVTEPEKSTGDKKDEKKK